MNHPHVELDDVVETSSGFCLSSTLQAIFDSAPFLLGIVEISDNDILHLADNPMSAHFFNLSPEQMRGKWASEIGAPADVIERWLNAYRTCLTRKKPHSFEYLHHDRGIEKRLFATVCPIEAPDAVRPRFSYVVKDLTTFKEREVELEKKDNILEVLAFAAERLLKSSNWDENINDVLKRLGEVMHVSRTYIFKNQPGDGDRHLTSQIYEWAAPGIEPQIDNSDLQNIDLSEFGFQRWVEALREGSEISGLVRDFPESEVEALAPQGIVSIAVVPILLSDEWWGFIGFDDCHYERAWTTAELKALRLVANLLGAADRRRKKEERLMILETAVSEAAESIVITDADLVSPGPRMIYVNKAYERMTGYSSGEVMGKSPRIVQGPESDRDMLDRLKARLNAGKQFFGETINYRRDGTPFNVEFSISPVKNGQEVTHYVAVQRDTTDHHRINRELTLIRTALENASEAVLIADLNQRIVFQNRSMTELFGYTQEEINEAGGPAILVSDKIRFADIGTSIHQGGRWRGEIDMIDRNGEAVFVALTIDSVRDQKGQIIGVIAIHTDMREAKHRELERLEEKRFMETALNVMPDAFFVIDREGRLIRWNENLRTVTGLSDDDLFKRHAFELVDPKSHQDLANAIQTVFERGYTDVELQILRNGSEPIPYWINGAILRDINGNPSGICGTGRDILERKQIEAALREGKRRYRHLIENAGDIIYRMDLQGRFTYANPAAIRTMEYDREAIIGRTFIEFIPSEQREYVASMFAQCLTLAQNETFRGEFTAVTRTGKHLIFEQHVQPILRKGHFIGLQAIVRDITSRKRAEQAVLESERKYRSVVDHIKEVIFQTDAEGRWTFLNPAWTEITGFTIEESLGTLFLDYVHEADRDRNFRELKKLIDREKDYCRHEVRYYTRSGGYRWIEVHARLVLDEADQIIGTSGSLRDVTDIRKAIEVLETALEKERELGELKTRFVSMASHELRTPLATIQASAELVDRFGDRWSPEKRQKHLHRICDNVKDMTELLEDVLLVGKAEGGRMEYTPGAFSLLPFVRKISEEIQMGIGAEHDLLVILPDTPINVVADERLIKLALNNLLSNAFKYSPKGSPVQFEARIGDRELTFRIIDRGIGIPAADCQRLFEPFYRGGNVGAVRGTGLGLSIVKRAVDAHGGQLLVESREGEGSTVTCSFPVQLNQEAEGK